MAGIAANRPIATWLAAIVESSDDAIISKTLDGIITSWNPAAQRLFGYTVGEAVGRHVSMLAAPGHEGEMPTILERLRRGEKIDHFETVRQHKHGRLVDVSLTVSPIRDRAGRIVGASKIARDITERRRFEQALRQSEERFRALTNAVPDMVWTADADGTITFANDRWFEFCGISPEQNARGWPDLVLHPDDRARCLEQWTRALREGTDYEIEVRNRRYDGEYRWFLTRAVPIRDEAGRVSTWFGSTTDIQGRKEAEERQRILAAELSHRVKNILAVVQVLAGQSGSRATSVDDFLQAFRGRLQALSSAHNALMASDWRGAGLAALARAALGPYLSGRSPVQLDVEDLSLAPELALTITLALHELATNAAKYGALSTPAGRVILTARVERRDGVRQLCLVWQEEGGPPVRAPEFAGFGTTMLGQVIEYQHHGSTELIWDKKGLLCRVTLPLADPTAVPEGPQDGLPGSSQPI